MRAKPTRRFSTLASISWTAFQHIVKLADAAQIPIGGGALGIANQLIEMYNVADDNKNACAALVGTVAGYSETIWEFVQAMDPDYVKESEDKGAHIARNGIRRFGTALDEVSLTLRKISGKGKLKGMLSGSSTKDQLSDCDTRLRQEHDRFNGSRMNVLVAGVQDLSTKPEAKPKITEYQIFGARRLQPSEIELLSQPFHFPGASSMVSITRLCDTLFHAKVEGRVRMVKIYYDHSGGRDGFQSDMMFFERNPHPDVLGIYGYCDTATVPLVVLRDEKLRNNVQYLIDVMSSNTRLDRWQNFWKALQQAYGIVIFLQRRHESDADVSLLFNEIGQAVISTEAYGSPLTVREALEDSWRPFGQELIDWWDEFEDDDELKNCDLLESECCPRFSFWSTKVANIPSSKLWIGDFGIFVAHPGKPTTFQKMGNILNKPWTDLAVPSFPYGKHQILHHRDDRFNLCGGQQATQIVDVESSNEDDGDSSETFGRHLSYRRWPALSRRETTGSTNPSAIMLDGVYPRRIGRQGDDDWEYDGKMHCDIEKRAQNFFETHWTRLKMRYDVDPLDLVIVCRLEAPVREDSGICDCVWSGKRRGFKPSLCREGPRPSVTIAPTIGFGPHICARDHCSMEGACVQEAPSSTSHQCCSHDITFAVDIHAPQTELTFLRPPLTGFPDSDDIIDTMPGAWPIREVA